jgi:hypothetical protein
VVDPEMQAIYDRYFEIAGHIFSEEVGTFGQYIANSSQMASWANQLVFDFIRRETDEDDYVLIQNSGGWRSVAYGRTPDEPVDYWFLNTLMPFDNEIYLFQLKGEYLINFLNARRVTGTGNLGSSPVITNAHRTGNDWFVTSSGERIDPDKLYKVSMNDFMFTGGDNYGVIAGANNPPLDRDYAVFEYETLILGVPLREAMARELRFRSGVSEPETDTLILSTQAHLIKAGDYFTLRAGFTEAVESNVVVLNYTFDGGKFEYASFTPSAGVSVIDVRHSPGEATITLMKQDYGIESLGEIMLLAKTGAQLRNSLETVSLIIEYVVRGGEEKEVRTAGASAIFTTYVLQEQFVLIDLSNIIDWFGYKKTDESGAINPDWYGVYTFWDFNNNGEIDIFDITFVAQRIRL